VTPEQVHAALRPETVLVTIMHANNEVGTLQGLAEIASVTRARDVYLHADAAQSAGKVPIDVRRLGVDLLTIAGHKLYAPKGIGAVYVRRGVELDPLVHGSGQERGLRAGTENVPSIVALGLAAELSAADLEGEAQRLTGLRDALFQRLSEAVPGLQLNGDAPHRLPNTLNVSFPGTLGQTVLACAPDLAASTGSACHSGRTEASPVLSAMGLPRERALGAVRLSLGRWTTPDDVDRAVDLLSAAYRDAVGAPVTMG
jgi:cysteine desulfurase